MVYWAYKHHLIYGFGDSLSHMTIARRLWDSPNPGLSQLGTTWLPIPHLFFALGSISIWAWRTGLGGSFFTIGCAVVTSVSLYRIGQRSNIGNAGGWLAAMIMATNPSWSFLSATPMTEPFTVALICLTTASLLRWAQSERPYSAGMTALFCGLPAAAGVLSRYEGWAFAAVAGLAVAWISWRRFGWSAMLRRQFIAFAALPAICVTWWFVFNWGVYGNPLAFENGKYSSRSLVTPFASLGLLYGKGDIPAAAALYGKDILDIAGTVVVVLAIAGLVVTFATWRGFKYEIWLCLSSVGLFVVAALWQGQIYIRLPQMIPYGVENTRYGTEFLPFLALAAAQCLRIVPRRVAPKGRLVIQRWLAVGLLVSASFVWVEGVANGSVPASAITVLEAKANFLAGTDQRRVAQWIHQHATSGYILLDETIFPVIPIIGFDLHRVIITSSGTTYQRLLHHPRLVTWVAVDVGNVQDTVWSAYHHEGAFGTLFFPVQNYGDYVIYKQEPPGYQIPADSLINALPHQGR
jgi:4-amino-4-deoxy-L-arabinose transferase-like glycosyltransferase